MGPFASPGGALGSCLGLLRDPWGPIWMLKGAYRSQKSSEYAPKNTNINAEHGHLVPLALSTFQSLPGHDLSALPSDYECREVFDGAARPRSIGPVDVSELQCAQNSSFGGVEATILDTLIGF